MKQILLLAIVVGLMAGCASRSNYYRPDADPELTLDASSTPAPIAAPAAAPYEPPAPRMRASTSGQRVDAEGFTVIFDGRWDGWIVNENPQSWKIVNDAFRASGPRSHAFYIGDPNPFRDFELKVDVKTQANSNGGVYFHTRYQDEGWPKYGFETQVNVTHSDWKKTGSIYDVVNVRETPATDEKWWTQHIIVKGNKVTVKVDGQVVAEYTEPAGHEAGADFTRKIDAGTFALQCHDPVSVVYYRNIRVKRL